MEDLKIDNAEKKVEFTLLSLLMGMFRNVE